jgi:tryptophanyl-tRNA synthetase
VLTGYRPTGPMHIGHWFGNVMNLVRLQEDHEAFYFLADWHMLTTHYDRTEELPENVRTLALDLVAAGVDPNRVTFYRQSDGQGGRRADAPAGDDHAARLARASPDIQGTPP